MEPLKRTIFLTHPRFQLSLLAFGLGMAVVIISILYTANIYLFMRFAEKGKDLPFGFLKTQLHTMNLIFILTSILTFVLLFLLSFLLSNRVAGSLYRMQEHLKKMKDAPKYEDLQFRDNDFFREVADNINEFARHIKNS